MEILKAITLSEVVISLAIIAGLYLFFYLFLKMGDKKKIRNNYPSAAGPKRYTMKAEKKLRLDEFEQKIS